MLSIIRLSTIRNRSLKYVSRLKSNPVMSARSKTSRFWAGLFSDRKNFPSLDELLTFQRSDFTYGVGNDSRTTHDQGAQFFKERVQMVLQNCPQSELSRYPEPVFGSPKIFEFEDVVGSAAFIVNVDTYYHLKGAIEKYVGSKNGIRFLEIGAGYGGVAFLVNHDQPSVESYTICDLPENLFLSSIFLQMNFPEKRVRFLSEPSSGTAQLNFCLPDDLDETPGPIDVVLNTFSIQEMDADSVHDYINWIEKNLSDEGIFYSVNSHGKAGILRASEYGYQRFDIKSLRTFRKAPAGIFNSIPYEVILKKNPADSVEYNPEILDSLTSLMQLGVDSNIQSLCDSFTVGNLTPSELAFLKDAFDFFSADSGEKKELCAKAMVKSENKIFSKGTPITDYLSGNLSLVNGRLNIAEEQFQRALATGLQDFARFRALLSLALISRNLNNSLTELKVLAPGLFSEAQTLLKDPSGMIRFRADCAQRLGLKFKVSVVGKLRMRLGI